MGEARSPRLDRRLPAPLLLVVGAAVLGGAAALSLFLGSHAVPAAQTWRLLWHPDDSVVSGIIHDQRVPRTVLTATVGAALGLAGALMQALTRNPLAEPGILGINAGASLAVVVAVAIAGVSGIGFYLWFAFLGAAVTAAGVHLLAGVGHATATPVRLALAGVAVSAALTALVQTVILADQVAFNEFRHWVVGSTEGRGWPVLQVVAPFLVVGAVLALLLSPALNAMALGDDTAQGLGVRLARVRTGSMVAATLLCGAATAAIGPITFVGLAVPLAIRALIGPDQRWIATLSILGGAAWLLVADVLSRVVIAPQEVQVGVVAALLGAPIFIAMVSRRKVVAL